MNLANSIDTTLEEASLEVSAWDPVFDKKRLFHSNFERLPYAICAPSNATEIAIALDTARKNNMPVSVCCAGHHISGRALVTHGLVISLEKFKNFEFREDGKIVVVGAGMTWGELDSLCKPLKIGTTGGIVSYTGVSGLALGGGIGWLNGLCGLSCDNIAAVKVVDGTGQTHSFNSIDHPEYIWAFRGAGTELGVVYEISFNVIDIHKVCAGSLLFKCPVSQDVLTLLCGVFRKAPDDLTVSPQFFFRDGEPFLSIDLCGATDCFDRLPELGELMDCCDSSTVKERVYHDWQSALDNPARNALRAHWETSYINNIDPSLFETLEDQFLKSPSKEALVSVDFIHGRAASQGEKSNSCFPHRGEQFCLLVNANWHHLEDDELNKSWARNVLLETSLWTSGKRYPNYAGDVSLSEYLSYFSEADKIKLRKLKAELDPLGIFVGPQPLC